MILILCYITIKVEYFHLTKYSYVFVAFRVSFFHLGALSSFLYFCWLDSILLPFYYYQALSLFPFYEWKKKPYFLVHILLYGDRFRDLIFTHYCQDISRDSKFEGNIKYQVTLTINGKYTKQEKKMTLQYATTNRRTIKIIPLFPSQKWKLETRT